MKNKHVIVISLALLSVTLAACGTKAPQANQAVNPVSTNTNVQNTAPNTDGTPASSTVTLAEIANHASANDCWMMIDGQSYDFTPYIQAGMHPGGAKIVNGCGQDASAMFAAIEKHSGRPRQDMAKYLIVR